MFLIDWKLTVVDMPTDTGNVIASEQFRAMGMRPNLDTFFVQ